MSSSSHIYTCLRGRRAFVSGGASGIGLAIVERLVKEGVSVGFVDIDEDAGTMASERLGKLAHFRSCDLRDLGSLAISQKELRDVLGPFDIIVNNAARDDRTPISTVDPASWDELIATNLRHYFFAAQAAVPDMVAAGRGVIINIGSISWHVGLGGMPVYATAKAAITGLTNALARDLGPSGIRVVCVIPGAVSTPRQEELWVTPETLQEILSAQCLKERIKPEHVASMTAFLASDEAAMCTSREYHVDAGWL
ncbi:Pyridoxal 4-dehydrogenase [Tsuneonella dongtanensis]|uniref:Pyridoxal 4-dehydrogenase n=1 Tax=Tsuneonella dongtanensis TaxID=692370 RepID=A0A1B2A965_9SPHN|nr:SDR family oxidoreductase [Tsuneonella dongtanensis]ANY18651.1 Pyridoxal 4-dehydrogenase [Tsuneonella dongtanensis]